MSKGKHPAAARWAAVVGAIATTGLALVLGFVLTLSGATPAFYERQVVWLFWATVAVAALLTLVIGIAATRLVVRLRRGKFGARLMLRLAGIFALVGVLPGAIIYTVSYQFVSRSIEAWFDVRVEGALDAGLTLGRGTLEALSTDLSGKTYRAAQRLADARAPIAPLTLERLREELAVEEVSLLGPTAQVLATAGVVSASMVPERPPPSMFRQARAAGVVGQFEGLDDEPPVPGVRTAARLRALALMPSTDMELAGTSERFLLVVQTVPPSLVANALAVQAAYREYQQRALARDGLRRMYIGTLTLSLVLSVFGAVLLALLFGNRLARPLLLLAEGVRQVAQGDLTAKPVSTARDELGGLTRSFAEMTEQLGQARGAVQRGVQQLEGARTRLQTILDNLSSGVIVFDRERRIDTVNPGATRILRAPMSVHVGQPLDGVPGLEVFAQGVWQRFDQYEADPRAGERDHWQESYDLRRGERDDGMTLLVRGAQLPLGARLMVFDDITEVVSAQRQAAWSEVARRLAHEIKNPLTPIQLSAERLKHKLDAKLEGADRAMLTRSVDTIVNQVQSMKQLVNEFRDYARLPAAQLIEVDLNELVSEVLGLYANEQDVGQLQAHCDPLLPPIMGDPTQLRQVIHNLVQNALDAVASRPDGHVQVQTERGLDELGAVRAARLKVQDNGPGFAEKVLGRAFEPYVTTKVKGTGLGLAVVKKIADEHGARVRLANLPLAGHSEGDVGNPVGDGVTGAQVSLSFSRLATASPAPIALAAAATGPATRQ